MIGTDHLLKTATLISRRREIKCCLQWDIENIVVPVASKPVKIRNHDIPKDDGYDFSRCDAYRIGFFINELCHQHLWPMAPAFRYCSINKLCEGLEGCDFGELLRVCDYEQRCDDCDELLTDQVGSAVAQAKESFQGLCLDCVKHHKKDKEEWAKCRIPHTDFRGLEQDRNTALA